MDADFVIPEDTRRRYLERRLADVETLSAAWRAGDFTEFKRIGHQLKGNAASFGYKDLEVIAIDLEKAGLNKDRASAENQLELLKRWVSAHKTD